MYAITREYFDADLNLAIEVEDEGDGLLSVTAWRPEGGNPVELSPLDEARWLDQYHADMADLRDDAADMAYQARKERDL